MELKEITANDTYPLRHKILRPHQPLSYCEYPGDFELQNFHLGWYDEEELVCIGSFYQEKYSDLPGELHYRLRGMATLENYRNRQLALKLLQAGMKRLKEKGTDLMWCNARIVALGLYEKAGMKVHGGIFEMEGIGPHKVMYINLRTV